MMFQSIWNKTNPRVTERGSASNLDAPQGSIPIKRSKNADVVSRSSYSCRYTYSKTTDIYGWSTSERC